MDKKIQEKYDKLLTKIGNQNDFNMKLVKIREKEIELLREEREELHKRIIELT